MRSRWWAAPVLAAAVIGLAACGSSGSSTSSTTPASPAAAGGTTSSTPGTSSTSGSTIKTAHTSLGTIVVNSQGFAIYMFGPDTATASKCTGSCATYWPPVKGPVTALPGSNLRPKLLGTIKRADGTIQATYAGHPLYTYKADSSPGQASGQGLNVSGGKWYVLAPSGKIITAAASSGSAPSPSPSTSTSSGGYGY
jgi:predicted lipoprotein with Yx(FWY)xxD motif